MKTLLIVALITLGACSPKAWQALSNSGNALAGNNSIERQIRRQNQMLQRMESKAVERCFHQNVKTGRTTFC